MRNHRVLTMRMKKFEKWGGAMKRYKYTRIIQNWPSIKVHSKWYFQTKGNQRVYLKIGWNVIGCRQWNNIWINERRLETSCEIAIRVAEDNSAPIVHDAYGSCLYNGCSLGIQTFSLLHDSVIAIRTNTRDIIFHFFNKDLDIEF